jgi:putative ABC transport system ATP-binding protein
LINHKSKTGKSLIIVIHLEDVNKTYFGAQPLHVLKGINLDIYENEFLVVLGESGCGKSTMMNIVGGMDFATSGTLTVEARIIPIPAIRS